MNYKDGIRNKIMRNLPSEQHDSDQPEIKRSYPIKVSMGHSCKTNRFLFVQISTIDSFFQSKSDQKRDLKYK